MAVELYSDSSGVSPRISFSHDLCISDIVPLEQQPLRRTSLGSLDFDFCVRKSFEQDSSSADELFSDGKILPTEVKKRTDHSKQTDHRSFPPAQDDSSAVYGSSSKRETMKEMKSSNDEAEEKQSSSKSFWRFKRSSSLNNCGSSYGRSLCPLPPLLSRSYSTGSTPSVKRGSLSKDVNSSSGNHKQHKQSFFKSSSSSSSSSTNYQKPPLKKNYGSTNYGNGVRVSPVLNVPSGNLFGLGSIFFNGNGKDKNKKK
ncbi:hypothetical protein Tsubulata_022669 [Turnera subulata]|uniref:Uncharacterized protein n=1 Tax=Turnera subulata TaxID=218843 RepID=A0A9Q0J251_9ROSI|nr:hypothetical protein Tsubulata_022669 [Turnera subulata]